MFPVYKGTEVPSEHAPERGKWSIDQRYSRAMRLDTARPHGYDTHPQAPVAQLDRVSASEAEGRRFKSCRARQTYQGLTLTRKPFCFVVLMAVTTLVTTKGNPKPFLIGVIRCCRLLRKFVVGQPLRFSTGVAFCCTRCCTYMPHVFFIYDLQRIYLVRRLD